jgi:hypothetical protein
MELRLVTPATYVIDYLEYDRDTNEFQCLCQLPDFVRSRLLSTPSPLLAKHQPQKRYRGSISSTSAGHFIRTQHAGCDLAMTSSSSKYVWIEEAHQLPPSVHSDIMQEDAKLIEDGLEVEWQFYDQDGD